MNLKHKFEENRRAVIFAAAALAVLVVAYALLGPAIAEKWPGERKIQDKIEVLKKKQKELQIELNKENWLRKNRESFIENSKIFWIPERDGDPEANAQKRVEEAAESAGLVLSTVGKVSPSNVAEGILQLEISINAKASVDQVMAFLEQIYKRSPRFYWASINLNPDNIRSPKDISVSGTLRFISITDPENGKKLLNNKIIGEKDEKGK